MRRLKKKKNEPATSKFSTTRDVSYLANYIGSNKAMVSMQLLLVTRQICRGIRRIIPRKTW